MIWLRNKDAQARTVEKTYWKVEEKKRTSLGRELNIGLR